MKRAAELFLIGYILLLASVAFSAPSSENADTEFTMLEEVKVKASIGDKQVSLTLPKGCRITVLAIRTKDDVLACR